MQHTGVAIESLSPKVSIGICAYNEEKNIGVLLENLLSEQDLSLGSEIIVVCSGCDDRTSQITEEFSYKDNRVKLVIEPERQGKASALNHILKIYQGNILFLIPADVIPAPFSISKLLERMLSNPNIGVSCGRPVPINGNRDMVGYIGSLIWRLHDRTLRFLDNHQLCTHASGELMAVKKGIVNHIPLNIVNDDAYIAVQAMSKGFGVQYCRDSLVYIRAPVTLVDFINQRRRVVYGHHRVKQLTKRYPRTLENMIFFDPSKTFLILMEEMKERPKEVHKLFGAIMIEAFVNLLALTDVLAKRSHTIWKMAGSTKRLQ